MDYAHGFGLSYSIGYNGDLRKEQMMEANELRIGNWYWWNAEGNNYEYQIVPRDLSSPNLKNCEPIPLTEEWLLRFGWVWNGGSGYKAPHNDNYWWFSLRIGFIPSIVSDNAIPSCGYIGCKYVHQLQNLYFALTGTELELK